MRRRLAAVVTLPAVVLAAQVGLASATPTTGETLGDQHADLSASITATNAHSLRADWRDAMSGMTAIMEPTPGIFSSSSTTDDWRVDDDPPSEVHVLIDEPGLQAGFWRALPGVTPALVRWAPPGRELIAVVRGQAHLQIEDGLELELSAGSVAALPAGARVTWQVSHDFLEFWVLVLEPQ
jgi:uncharacterized cupin superfamily protein